MSKSGQSIAVSVTGASDGQTKYDSKYVRMIAEYFYQDEQGEFVYENIPLHSCTEAEWAKFNKPDSVTISYFK